MAIYADVRERPDWLKELDKRAFDRYMRDRRDHPLGAAFHAIVDLARDRDRAVEFHSSGASWQHGLALAARIIERLKHDPDLRGEAAPVMQARLDAALEALDVGNIWLETGPVK